MRLGMGSDANHRVIRDFSVAGHRVAIRCRFVAKLVGVSWQTECIFFVGGGAYAAKIIKRQDSGREIVPRDIDIRSF